MKNYSKPSQLLAGCLLPLIPLLLDAQVGPHGAMTPPPPAAEIKAPVAPPSHPGSPPLQNNQLPAPSKPPSETDRILAILDFWFGALPGPDFFPEDKLSIWFGSTPEIDRQIRNNFSQEVINAGRGDYNSWRETPDGRLALILLLDQFPRRIYRNQPQQFLLDRMAQTLVLEGMQKGDDKELYLIERAFFYLPLEHAEDLNLQNLSVASYRQLVADSSGEIRYRMEDFLQSAMMHQQQIARFGRFPHRNAILGRESTPEETLFLMQWRGS